MSWMDEYNKAMGRSTTSASAQSSSWMQEYRQAMAEYEEEKKKKEEAERLRKMHAEESKVKKETLTNKKEEEDDSLLDFFQAGALDDINLGSRFKNGYQFGDITKSAGDTLLGVGKAILGTAGDAGLEVAKGAGNMLEGVADLFNYGVAGVADLAGKDDFADRVRKGTQKNLVDEWTKGADDYLEQFSFLGRTSDAVAQGIGQVGTILLTGGLGQAAGLGTAGVTALTTGSMGLSGMGSGMGEAYRGGATDEEALLYGSIAGAADALSELMFGGLGKAVKATGLSTGLLNADDMLAKKVSSMFSSQLAKNLSSFGVKAAAEGFEEVVAGTAQAIGKWATYASEEKNAEELWRIVQDENLLEQFVVGAIASGIAQAPSLHTSVKSGTDFITGMTQNEETVVQKEIEKRIAEAEKGGTKLTAKEKAAIEAQVEKDLDKGYISTDTIEEVLGGETYQRYKQTVDSENALREKQKALQEEFDTLNKMKQGEMTGEQIDRRADLKEELAKINESVMSAENHSPKTLLQQRLTDSVKEMVRSDRLIESYNERERRKQYFEADLTKYTNPKARQSVQNLMDAKVANNTNRTREMADTVAKIAEDKDIVFHFTSNQKLKEEGNAYKSMKEFTADGNTAVFELGTTKIDTDFQPIVKIGGETVQNFKVDFDKGTITFENAPAEGQISVEFRKTGMVNGFNDGKGNITINMDSPRYWNFIVGHEVTHSLEKAKAYEDLQKAVFAYAQTKGEYQGRYDSLKARYNEGTNIEQELTADLVGDYIFNDQAFVNDLSTNHQNIFQKIFSEIKYLLKIVTAGSKEARQLEKAKRMFEKAYREAGKAQKNTADGGVKYALMEYSEQQKKNWATSKRIVIYDNPQQLSQFIQDSVANKTMDKKMYFGAIPADLAARIESDAGVNVENYNLSLGSYEIRKILKDHGNEATESPRGQRAIVEDDFAHIVDVVLNPKSVELSDNTYMGKPAIVFTGEHNGRMNVVAVVSDKRLDLFVQTVFVNIKKGNLATPTGEQAPINTPEASSGTVSKVNVAQNGGDVKHSLSAEQEEYFKDSSIRDGDGNLMVLYHGTQNDFTVFDIGRSGENYEGGWSEYGEGIYLTPDKKSAEYYGDNAGWGREVKLMEVYANIKNPFNVNDPVAFDISDLVQKYELTEFDERHIKKAGDRLVSFLQYHKESVRDYLMGKGYDGVWEKGLNGDVYQVVAYAENQIKNVDNVHPTGDPDIRFSLSETVEETKDLMAIHNLHSSELMKQLQMGGMPYPSIAITKPEMISHDNFGEVSVVLKKDAIDPKKSKYNKVYSADAYTPTFPQVDYEASEEAVSRITSTVNKWYNQLSDYYQRSVRSLRDYDNINDGLNRWGGEQRYVESYADDYGLKQVYLAENGGAVPVEMKTTETRMTDYQMKLYQTVVDKMGADVLKSFNEKGNYEKLGLARMAWLEKHGDALKDIYAEDWASDGTMTKAEALEIANEQNRLYWRDEIGRALKFIENGGVTVTETEDIGATNAKIDERIANSDYSQWVRNLFSGIEGRSGIRNNKDIFTPSGNRRSFAQTHDPLTIDNIVKAMRKENQTGQGAFGSGSILGASAKEFGSIAEIKRNAGKLGQMDKAEHDAITDRIQDTFWDISRRYADGKDIIDAQATLAEAVSKSESKAGITRYLKQYDYVYKYNESIVDEIIELRDYIRSLPTPYFEAKPRRGVGFDEVAVFVIPYDADVKLKQELLNRGYPIAEYDPKVEGDRQRVVNQFEEYKFSLSDASEQHPYTGNFGSPARDLRVEVQEEAAPVAVSKTETTTPATVSNEEMVQIFPDEVDPIETELDSLLQEQETLESRMMEAIEIQDYDTYYEVNDRYKTVTDRIAELERESAEADFDRIDSIQDEDAPPEMEAPYYGEPSEPAVPEDPFEDRDYSDVGKRNVNAYMYENPEVKPFFQAEARVMLGDLGNSIRGEKIFNDQVYYDSGGEKGWSGTKRQTTDDIAYLLDSGYTYAQIEAGLNAIIEDNGKENNAVSKRIEFALNDRLLHGYTGVWGETIPADQGYINLLNEKQINEYSQEAFNQFMANADQYAPEEDIAPTEDFSAAQNIRSYGQQTFMPPRQNIGSDDIAPTYDVTGKKGVPDGQQAFMPDAGVEPKLTRKQLHQNIMDRVKSFFQERGFDFDTVLKKAKDLSTFATVDNIPQRVMEKALGYKQGQALSELTVNQVAKNETEGIKWLNSFTNRKNGLLAQISKQYNIKPGSKKSAAAQMYAEGFYVGENDEIIAYGDRELAMDFPNVKVQNQIKGLARDPRIRQIYDETLASINESRARNAYPEIPRLDNYFLHFRAMEDTFSRLGLPFNPNDIRAKDLPTDLNGVTADLKPGQPYFASAMHRTGKRTSFDLLGGLEKYLTSAKNQIYHIDDIQTLRAVRNYIAEMYGQATGLENLDELSDEEAQQRIEDVYGSHLSTFAKFLNEEANVLAGKTALIDRGLEGIIGRRGITFLNALNRQVGSNMVGYNISSSLTNFLAPVQALAKSRPDDFIKGFAQTVFNRVGSIVGQGDGFADASPVMIRRKGADAFYRTPWQKLADPGYVLMGAVDDFSTEMIARAKYNELTRKGMDSQQAHYETDKWVSRLMGDRSLGQQPQLYNSKMLGLVTKFQLEVRNQLDSQFYDTIQDAIVSTEDVQNGLLRNAKRAAKIAYTFAALAGLQHVFGKAFESVAGYNPAFDIIEAIIKAFGWDDEEDDEDTVLDNLEEAFFELMGDMPYVSALTGGRIPIESALPIEELYKGEDQYGNEKSRWKTLAEAAPYYILPGGAGQLKKTLQGLSMFDEDHPIAGSYTDSGNLRFPVEDTTQNRVQAGLFGQWASQNARDYFDEDYAPLKENQIQEFIDSDMPIRDYRDYREGLKDLSKQAEKVSYINGLDLSDKQKDVLKSYLFDEAGYAEDNPEKYAFLEKEGIGYLGWKQLDSDTQEAWSWAFTHQDEYRFYKENGVTPEDYSVYRIPMLDFDDEKDEAYQWAFDYPDKATMGKVFSNGVKEYRQYTKTLSEIKADKDESGKTINGSRKDKVLDYINSLDIDYYEKLILFKNEYNADDTYNSQIIEYINSRSDFSYEEKVTILEELGFEVSADGRITW